MKTHQSDLSSMTIDQNEAESILEEISDYLTTVYPYKKQAAYLFDILPALKGGDSCSQTAMSRREYIL